MMTRRRVIELLTCRDRTRLRQTVLGGLLDLSNNFIDITKHFMDNDNVATSELVRKIATFWLLTHSSIPNSRCGSIAVVPRLKVDLLTFVRCWGKSHQKAASTRTGDYLSVLPSLCQAENDNVSFLAGMSSALGRLQKMSSSSEAILQKMGGSNIYTFTAFTTVDTSLGLVGRCLDPERMRAGCELLLDTKKIVINNIRPMVEKWQLP